jgi:hypothetical protein
MRVSIPLFEGLSLQIADRATGDGDYPTARLQRGLLLFDEGTDLAEEGIGFGVPIFKRGIQTIFPGGMKLAWRRAGSVWHLTAAFEMNLVERLAAPGGASVESRSLYAAKNSLAALHRRSPALRGPLTATSNALRRTFGWETTFEEAGFSTTVRVTYAVHTEEGRGGAGGWSPPPPPRPSTASPRWRP